MKANGTERFSDIVLPIFAGCFRVLYSVENLVPDSSLASLSTCFSGEPLVFSFSLLLLAFVKMFQATDLILFMSTFLAVLAYPICRAALSTNLGAATRLSAA